MKKLSLSICITLMLVTLLGIQSTYAEPLNINAAAYILIDSKSGQVLCEHNSSQKLRPASTTKMLTAITAIDAAKTKLENGLDYQMVATNAAISDIGPGGMNIGIMNGEILSLKDLLNALLVRSANETANIIAENMFATRDQLTSMSNDEIREERKQFVDLMNKKAQEIGATNTFFVNPCGKDNLAIEANHLTTAADLAIIARYGMQIPEFREIVKKQIYNMPATNKHTDWVKDAKQTSGMWYPLPTTNKLLLSPNEYSYKIGEQELKFVVNGVKTGYTEKAGNNLVSSGVNKDGMELIAVIMGVKNQGSYKVFDYTKSLLRYGFENFTLEKIADTGTVVKNVAVQGAADDKTLNLVTNNELKAVLPLDKTLQKVTHEEHINENLKAPIQKGQELGYIEYFNNGVSLGKVNVVASESIELKSIPAKTVDTAKSLISNKLLKIVIITLIIIAFLFLVLRYNLRRRSHSSKIKIRSRIE